MSRVRLGILLIVLSWLPVAQLIISVMHHNQQLTSSASTDALRLSVWGVQIVIGFIGIWLVGKEVVAMSRASGWRHVPAKLWQLFRKGS